MHVMGGMGIRNVAYYKSRLNNSASLEFDSDSDHFAFNDSRGG